jgi:nitric oxide reductase subunit B
MGEESLSPWWRRCVIVAVAACFAILGLLSVRTYRNAPPIPRRAVAPSGEVVFTDADIRAGQQVFLKHGLMENGTLWGHGAYLGPDFSAQYLHNLGLTAAAMLPASHLGGGVLQEQQLDGEIARELKQNRYDASSGELRLTAAEAASYRQQLGYWSAYFAHPEGNGGLPEKYISDPGEIRELTAFFAWAAWASVADRPETVHSYTNNFPYDPLVGNTPTSAAILWSALSLITLLGGLALALFAFGRWNFLGWRQGERHIHPHFPTGLITPSQRATMKYFVVVAVLFLAQVVVGGATEHYRADPRSFYGIQLAAIVPSQILRIWHLQLALL